MPIIKTHGSDSRASGSDSFQSSPHVKQYTAAPLVHAALCIGFTSFCSHAPSTKETAKQLLPYLLPWPRPPQPPHQPLRSSRRVTPSQSDSCWCVRACVCACVVPGRVRLASPPARLADPLLTRPPLGTPTMSRDHSAAAHARTRTHNQ